MANPRIRKRLKVVSNYAKTSRVVSSRTPFTKAVLIAFLVNFSTVILNLTLKDRLPPEVPLFYGAAEGQEQIASSSLLIIPPIISSLFIAINIFLSYILEEDEFLKKALILTAISTSLLAATTTIKIIFLVGSL